MAEDNSKYSPEWLKLTASWLEDMIGDGPHCLRCVHYLNETKCTAFPSGIPDEVADGANHITPFLSDNGIQYQEHAGGVRRLYGVPPVV